MFSFLRRKPDPIDPVLRATRAIDELNAAIAALPRESQRLRPWTRPAGRTSGRSVKVVLGYWDFGGEQFVTTYEGE